MENIREIVRQLVLDNFLLGEPSKVLLDDADLQEDGILDSLSTLKLVSSLEKRFDIMFMPEELGGDGFSTVANIEQLVKSKLTVPS